MISGFIDLAICNLIGQFSIGMVELMELVIHNRIGIHLPVYQFIDAIWQQYNRPEGHKNKWVVLEG